MSFMKNIQAIFLTQGEPFLSLGILTWTILCLIWCLLIFAAGFAGIRIRKLKDQKAELDRQLVERNELLTFAAEREKKAQENAALANQSRQQLLSRINHDIRTPMNGVIGMSALLAETTLTNEQREYNETIRTCGESLLTVVNDILHGDLLAHSKLESGKSGIEQKDFDLRNNVEEVLDVFAGHTARTDVELLYKIGPQVPVQITADSQRLRQVLMNLVENAIKFTHVGEVLLSVQTDGPPAQNTNDIKLRFEVRDTGVGIADERLKSLSRELSETDTSKGLGKHTGVGLFLCQKLIMLMGGEMKIHSKAGVGTTVMFTISVRAGSSVATVYKSHDVAALEGKQVLIIDDNATAATILKEELGQWKLIPTVAGSGHEALEIISQGNSFDLVLTDLKMPEMDGIALAQSIRQIHPKIPIILLSNEGDETGKLHPDLFSSVVNKPIRRDVLSKHILSKLLQKDQPSSEEMNVGQKLSANFALQFPLRILIAEDNRMNQKLAMKVLGKLGYNPDIADDGKEVLEMVGDSTYDLILMDVQMPEMDGLEATRMIRLCLEVQPVIVAMTANSMQGDREECLQAGMDDYISKPVHLEELVIILERWALVVKEKGLGQKT